MLERGECIGSACEKVWHVECGVVIMKVDHILLTAVHVWHANIVYVVTDDVAGVCCCGHVSLRVDSVAAVGAEAILTCNIACECCPRVRRVPRASRQQFDDFGAAVVEACVQ
eukprot:6189975-Pleurochrysis_carterae.AAC.2